VGGVWRVDNVKEGQEEWVLITGWESVEQHVEFGKSEQFKEYAKFRPLIEGFDVKHAKLMKLES